MTANETSSNDCKYLPIFLWIFQRDKFSLIMNPYLSSHIHKFLRGSYFSFLKNIICDVTWFAFPITFTFCCCYFCKRKKKFNYFCGGVNILDKIGQKHIFKADESELTLFMECWIVIGAVRGNWFAFSELIVVFSSKIYLPICSFCDLNMVSHFNMSW